MTGYTVHTGSTEKFTEGWDKIFGGALKSPTAQASGKKKRVPKKNRKRSR